ncbi:MAG: hypothetical protein PHE32_00735 [Candidatus Shapirobacteria bacterium]|nr:hypothetical protein [Candidatus Shapirobacteria bacterium]
MDYTPDQIEKLKSLGIDIKDSNQNNEFLKTEQLTTDKLKSKLTLPIFPLLSISGLTLLSFSGLIILKGHSSTVLTDQPTSDKLRSNSPTPTQVPKSIQHYLLTSQQLFTQALQNQKDQSLTIDLLNKSILAATEAIKEFPDDYRGYQQRGRIYQSLTDSQPKLIDQSISDIAAAQKLNPSSAEITHTLASLYAKKGDAQNTILYLNQTVALEPTKAQNFYDLAKIQQQVGLFPQALETYNRLISIVTDSTQKIQVESEKSALEKLISQNPNLKNTSPSTIDNLQPTIAPTIDSPTIQALADGGLIVAAPEEDTSIAVTNQTDSNSLSGNSVLPSNQKEISISNSQLTSTSQVYVTATKGGKNQNLQVLSKSKESFTVGLSSPINEDIEFKWWIIN